MTVKIATWNVNSIRVRQNHVASWLSDASPDILALQEIKVLTEQFPQALFSELGYGVICAGQKTYNGVAILSRFPCEEICVDLPTFQDPQRRVIAATVNGVRIINLYVPNGSEVGSEKYTYKLQFLHALHGFLQQQLQHYPKIIVLGDFNIAPQNIDVHDPAVWENCVLVSDEERSAFQKIKALGFKDSFRELSTEPGFTWWDYRQAAFRRNLGLRIDIILHSEMMRNSCKNCRVDAIPRAWEQPSDHAPVIAEFVL